MPNVKRGDDDFHGNFDCSTFERWFQRLCLALKKEYGQCRIHMDGATNHKRVLDPRPTTRWNKPEIADCLTSKSVSHTIGMLKKELLDLVSNVGGRKRYATREMAREHGHSVVVPLRTTQTSSRSSLRGPPSRIGSRRIRHPVKKKSSKNG
ncbi:TPA: hypothetical protein N0F65_006328 [Lagenidium giganteum]|uniref:Transposase n=1 Tax=Lagenidium giganteum TaxID=4803 RepID=A0AAV2YNJ3_9STRA|nr:TPA: hypothetical protein N0F65_006328 [Lagenidium giganteum]